MLFSQACIDPIEFERPETFSGAVAIQGKLAKGEIDYVSITIRKVFNFVNSSALVSAKNVTLIDDEGNRINIPGSQEGVHYLEFDEEQVSFKIEIDKCYHIEVQLFDGRNYSSEEDCLQPVPTPTSLSVSKVEIESTNNLGEIEKTDQLEFNIDTPLKSISKQDNARLLWELEMTYILSDVPRSDTPRKCFFTESPFVNYITLDGTRSSKSFTEKQLLWEAAPNYLFAEGFNLTVLQQSLTEKSYTYWNQVNQLLSRETGIFEPVDAKVISNFTNIKNPTDEVFGYFYATEEQLLRIAVSPEFAGNPRTLCPEPPSFNPNPNCIYCLNDANATLEKPAWWME